MKPLHDIHQYNEHRAAVAYVVAKLRETYPGKDCAFVEADDRLVVFRDDGINEPRFRIFVPRFGEGSNRYIALEPLLRRIGDFLV